MKLSEVSKYADPSALPRKEQEQLVGRRKRARHISQAGGTLGLMALATRTPQGVRAATSRSKRLSNLRPVKRIVDLEPKATRGSNTLGVLSIGTGSAGSFNYAGIQRAEAKADEKRIKKGLPSELRRVLREVPPSKMKYGRPKYRPDQFGGARFSLSGKDEKGAAQATYVANRLNAHVTGREVVPRTVAHYRERGWSDLERIRSDAAVGGKNQRAASRKALSRIKKRDDRFLREYRDRISPKAEAGYERMRSDRNRFRRNSAIAGGLAVSNALSGIHYARRRNPIMTAGSALAGTAMVAAAADQAHAARGYNRKMESNIRRRAKIRAQQGYYGEGRGLQPTDPTSKTRIKKGLMSAVRAPRLAPAGKPRVPRMPKSYGVRRGGLVKLPSGRQISRRGSVPGTGAFSR